MCSRHAALPYGGPAGEEPPDPHPLARLGPPGPDRDLPTLLDPPGPRWFHTTRRACVAEVDPFPGLRARASLKHALDDLSGDDIAPVPGLPGRASLKHDYRSYGRLAFQPVPGSSRPGLIEKAAVATCRRPAENRTLLGLRARASLKLGIGGDKRAVLVPLPGVRARASLKHPPQGAHLERAALALLGVRARASLKPRAGRAEDRRPRAVPGRSRPGLIEAPSRVADLRRSSRTPGRSRPGLIEARSPPRSDAPPSCVPGRLRPGHIEAASAAGWDSRRSRPLPGVRARASLKPLIEPLKVRLIVDPFLGLRARASLKHVDDGVLSPDGSERSRAFAPGPH